jgi:hypothetical protein
LRTAITALRWHHTALNRPFPKLEWALLFLACISLSSCAGQTAGERLAAEDRSA